MNAPMDIINAFPTEAEARADLIGAIYHPDRKRAIGPLVMRGVLKRLGMDTARLHLSHTDFGLAVKTAPIEAVWEASEFVKGYVDDYRRWRIQHSLTLRLLDDPGSVMDNELFEAGQEEAARLNPNCTPEEMRLRLLVRELTTRAIMATRGAVVPLTRMSPLPFPGGSPSTVDFFPGLVPDLGEELAG